MYVKRDKDFEDKIVSLYQSGKSYKDIHTEIGAGSNLIKRVLDERKIKTRSRIDYGKPLEDIAKLYKQGATFTELKEKYAVSSSRVYAALLREDISPRGLSWKMFDEKSEQALQIEKMFLSSSSLSQIAKKYACSRDAISSVLLRMGYSEKDVSYGVSFKFNGINLKSEYELRFAEILTSFDMKWRYEHCSYFFMEKNYTPDFFIFDKGNNLRFLVDVKGYHSSVGDRKVDFFPEFVRTIKTISGADFVISNPLNDRLVIIGMKTEMEKEKCQEHK